MAEKQLDINEIRKILPHRYPFLLIDRVLDYEIGKTLKALKNVTANEPFFQGHFPHYPVMPGVLMLEAMAQSCAILASLGQQADASEKHVYLFVGADNVRFRRPVAPGDQLIFNATMVRERRGMWKTSCQALVEETVVAECDIMFTYREVE